MGIQSIGIFAYGFLAGIRVLGLGIRNECLGCRDEGLGFRKSRE